MLQTDEQIYAADARDYLPVFARYRIVLDHGEGVYVYDTQGKKYIDFLGGIAVNVLGHGYPALVDAVAAQAKKMIHCSNLYYTEAQADAAEKLAARFSGGKVFFGNSGAEANEGAIKLARKYAHKISQDKSEIVCAWHSFHGRTLATLTATGQPKYHEGFGPLPEGFSYVDFGDYEDLEKSVNEKTCAVMLETIQGEGGVHVPPPDYFRKVRALCDKFDAVLILDEIQSGMGRTGKFFAYEHFGIRSVIVTLAKGLAGGVPIGAFVASDKVAAAFHAGDHGSTFGGNPLACAAANVVLDTMTPKFLEQVEEMGAYFKTQLKQLQKLLPFLIREVRGVGLILGMELTREGRDIVNACLDEGAIINCTAGNVLRFVPPLIVTKDEIDALTETLKKVLPRFA